MQGKKLRRLCGVICMLWAVLSLQAQYKVTGGTGTPLLTVDDSTNDIKVYLVNGVENVEISYTSHSSSHQWYRYKTRAGEAEPVSSVQNGMTSVISSVEDGYGYFVEVTGLNKYIWIIDYAKNPFNIEQVAVAAGNDTEYGCESISLTGTANLTDFYYYNPRGDMQTIEREYEVNYSTLRWDPEGRRFMPIDTTVIYKGNLWAKYIDAPLCDTDFQVTGDLFARHFGMEQSQSTDSYEAVRVEAYADTLLYADNNPFLIEDEEGSLSAPVEITFTAYANEPVASLFVWKIFRKGSTGEEEMLTRFTGDQITYTFREAGEFRAELEVSNRHGSCINMDNNYTIKIRESGLLIPNAFSPGTSPGVNDEFKVAYKSLVSFKGWIFNRWGVEMFHWTDPSQGWDGKKGGKYVSPGVYFYIIEAKGADGYSYKKKGSINIIRPKNIQDEILNP